MFFFEPLAAAHDRSQFEIFAYSTTPREDKISERLRGLMDHWRAVRFLQDVELARMIVDDAIDIVVDLAGHTASGRPGVLAMRPAPLLFTWLGYPNTTGLTTVDYRITDAVADPEGVSDERCAERLIRLPGSFLCFRPHNDAPPPGRSAGDGAPVFGCFNTALKLNRRVAGLWTRILHAVPNAQLRLRALQFRHPAAVEAARRLFIEAGLDAARLQLSPWRKSVPEGLADYAEIDVALDPFPYNGTTTTCEALWMGVPVVALAGEAHAARVGASLLTAVGIEEETVAHSPEDYLAKAVALAGNRDRLRRWRTELRTRMAKSSLRDEAGFARVFERALRNAWRERCARAEPSDADRHEARPQSIRRP
jgi:predicted O-linked N-acetylglucosamine transferase (SPINDLY family)